MRFASSHYKSTRALHLVACLFTASLGLVYAQTDAWHVDNIYELAVERLDPVVSPNQISGHIHRIVGGSAFKASYDGKEYEEASCSSVSIQADKSNYWMPNMYWMRNGTYIPIAAGFRFYMVLGRNAANEPVQPFPRGLQMVAGNANAKSAVMSTSGLPVTSYTCQKDHFKPIRLDKTMDNWNFETDCPEGLKTEIYFPPCWDGVNLYKADGSHMAYAAARGMNGCPFSHPIRLPHILLEYVWHTETVAPGEIVKGNLIWANGDTTGFGVHADFINGWDTEILRKALNDPACVGINRPIPMSSCPSLSPHMDIAAAKACRPSNGILSDALAGADEEPMKALPGCNLPWSSGSKPTCNPAPAAPALPANLKGTPGPLTAPPGNSNLPTTPSTDGWSNLGCLGAANTIQNMTSYNSPQMTVAKCKSYCREWGKPYCAVGWGYVCQAGDGFAANASMTTNCNIKCQGNASETCGGNGLIQLFRNSGSTAPVPSNPDPAWMGCRRGLANQAMLTGGTLALHDQTVSKCKAYCKARGSRIAGIQFGTHCSCGDSFSNGGGIIAPGWACNIPCKGNVNEFCGGQDVMSTFDTTKGDSPGSSSVRSSATSASSSKSTSSPMSSAASTSSSPSQCAAVTITKTVTVSSCTATVTVRTRRRDMNSHKL